MCATNFVFLQVIGRGNWYYNFHYSNDIENDFDCVIGKMENPEGNRSVVPAQHLLSGDFNMSIMVQCELRREIEITWKT